MTDDPPPPAEQESESVLLVFFESLTDYVPPDTSRPYYEFYGKHVKYDKGVIVGGRAYLLGKIVTIAWDDEDAGFSIPRLKPYCEISSSQDGKRIKFWQADVKRLHVFSDLKRPVYLSDYAIAQKLSRMKERWDYGTLEIAPISPMDSEFMPR